MIVNTESVAPGVSQTKPEVETQFELAVASLLTTLDAASASHVAR
jgi:hypothetical protein